MKIYTKVDQFTVDKFEEVKNGERMTVNGSDLCLVPVIFKDLELDEDAFFNVADGKLTMSSTTHSIDFGFKFYDLEIDGPKAIPEMLADFNSYIDEFRRGGIKIKDSGFFLCIDKMFFDLGYTGKMVLAHSIEKNEEGEFFITSSNYAENLFSNN